MIAVDSCTVVPLAYHERAHLTARTFRRDTHRSVRPLPRRERPNRQSLGVHRQIDLPFEPIRFADENIAALVAQSDIDHAVPPAPEFAAEPRRPGPACASSSGAICPATPTRDATPPPRPPVA